MVAHTPVRPHHRIVELDALRGIAAILVVLYHFTAGFGGEFGWKLSQPLITFKSAQIGVAIFFVISGFVILMTLERCVTAKDFAVSRFARLYPTFWVCALMTAALIGVSGFNPFHLNLAGFVGTLSMANGLTSLPYIDPSYWTLTRELTFYALLAAAYFSIGSQRLPFFVLAWVVYSALFNVLNTDPDLFTCHSQASCSSIVLNTMFAYLFAAGTMSYKVFAGDRRPIVFITLGAAIASGCVSEWSIHGLQPLISVKALLYVGLVLCASLGYLKPLRARALRFLGELSFSLYLIHQIIGSFILKSLVDADVNANIAIAFTCAAVAILSALVCFGVEHPSRQAIMAWHKKGSVINVR